MNEERKTLEQRAQMTDLERLRHSESHVLAPAMLRLRAAWHLKQNIKPLRGEVMTADWEI